MTRVQSVQTCRWGTPTLFLPWPRWFDASVFEWSCTRGQTPHGLPDSQRCATCPNWKPPAAAPAHHEDDHLGSVAP
jgi:hypothetical protein